VILITIKDLFDLERVITRFTGCPVAESDCVDGIADNMEGLKMDERRPEDQGDERLLILKLLTRRIGTIAPEAESQIQALSLEQLEALGEALLDFGSPDDLRVWLQSQDGDDFLGLGR
jgi:hypothetical protein